MGESPPPASATGEVGRGTARRRDRRPVLTAACALLATLPPSPAGALPAPDRLPAALAAVPGADLVFFDEPRAGRPTRVLAATRGRAAIDRLRAVMLDPAAYQRAVPSFRRAEVVARRDGALEVEWELEIPLWNLEGKLWLRPVADGVDIELHDGDFAPGLFRLRARAADGGAVVLWAEGHANVRDANWATRRLVGRSPLAEPALSAAATWVLLRALWLEAERPHQGADPRRNPVAAMAAPALASLDGRALAGLARTTLAAGEAVAAVRARPDGRLDRVEVALTARYGAEVLGRALGEAQRWRALPGWHRIEVKPATPPAQAWQVDSRFPFVDFDAVWQVSPGPPLRGQATGGDARGAVLGWDALEGTAPHTAVAVFSLHPRLQTAGYIPRKFIEAEPLLEHGLSLGLAYVDAASLVGSLARAAAQGKQ